MTNNTSYGVLTLTDAATRTKTLKLAFSNQYAMMKASVLIGQERKDLVVVDEFWGYETFDKTEKAMETIETFFK